MVKGIKSTDQVLNMDKTNNEVCSEKGPHRLVDCSNQTSVPGYDGDGSDVTGESISSGHRPFCAIPDAAAVTI
jgi:hypothetical protein